MREINQIHIHHTEKPTLQDFNGLNHTDILENIRYFHVHFRKFQDIGYHFLIYPDGITSEGRAIEIKPASIKGHNTGAIAICMVGNFDYEKPTNLQILSIGYKVRNLMDEYNVEPNKIIFHREFSDKTCPGNNIKKDNFMKEILS